MDEERDDVLVSPLQVGDEDRILPPLQSIGSRSGIWVLLRDSSLVGCWGVVVDALVVPPPPRLLLDEEVLLEWEGETLEVP